MELENNYLTFEKSDVYSYGLYSSCESEPRYTFFKDKNAKVYIKINKNCIYFLCLASEDDDRCNIKISDNFLKNPFCLSRRIDFEKMNLIENEKEILELVDKSFKEEYAEQMYLKEVKVYQIEDN